MITKRFSRCQTTGARVRSVRDHSALGDSPCDAADGLSCDGVPLAAIAAKIGTPAYVYSAASLRSTWPRFDAAFAGVPHAIHYALKANSTLALLRLLRGLGGGADANSWGEIEVALRAGFIPAQVVFTGVGKTPDELRARCRSASVDQRRVAGRTGADRRAGAKPRHARPRGGPPQSRHRGGRHPHISTGWRIDKFGMPIELGRALYRKMAGTRGLEPVGVHAHIGSQIAGVTPLRQAAGALAAFVRRPARGRHRARARRPRRRAGHLVRRGGAARR